MQPSSSECRKQEAIQWDRAKSEPLENVRIVAIRAAIAWGHQAILQERREASVGRAQLITDIMQEKANSQ